MSVAPFLLIAALATCIGLLTVTRTPPALRRSLFAAFIAALVPLPVLADAAAGTNVDLSGVAGTVVAGVGAIALWFARAAVNALIGYIQQKTKLELDDHIREYLYRALEQGISVFEARVQHLIGTGVSNVNVHSFAVAHAVNYVIDRVPDALAHFGITPAALTSMIEARVEARLPILFGTATTRAGAAVFQDGPALSAAGTPAGG